MRLLPVRLPKIALAVAVLAAPPAWGQDFQLEHYRRLARQHLDNIEAAANAYKQCERQGGGQRCGNLRSAWRNTVTQADPFFAEYKAYREALINAALARAAAGGQATAGSGASHPKTPTAAATNYNSCVTLSVTARSTSTGSPSCGASVKRG